MKGLFNKCLRQLEGIHSPQILSTFFCFLAVVLIACDSPPAPTIIVTTPDPTPTNSINPEVATVLAAITPTTDAQDLPTVTPTIAISEASSDCGKPEGWVEYIIRPSDTLFSLAALTDITVEEIKDVNCMLQNDIYIGEILFLPVMPPSLAAPAPIGGGQAEDPSDEENCSLACEENALDDVRSSLGAPGGEYTPCEDPGNLRTEPWISVSTENEDEDFDGEPDENRFDRELGERSYYFLCYPASYFDSDLENDDIAKIGTVDASIIWPTGTYPLDVEKEAPVFPEPEQPIDMGNAQRIIIWDIICNPEQPFPVDTPYTLFVTDQAGNEISLLFELKAASEPSILVVPQIKSLNEEKFDVYYCGWGDINSPEIIIESYYQKGFYEDKNQYILGHNRTLLPITITPTGHAKGSIAIVAGEPARLNELRYNDDTTGIRAKAQFWTVP